MSTFVPCRIMVARAQLLLKFVQRLANRSILVHEVVGKEHSETVAMCDLTELFYRTPLDTSDIFLTSWSEAEMKARIQSAYEALSEYIIDNT